MTQTSTALDSLSALLTLLDGLPALRLVLALAAWSALLLLLGCAVSGRLRRAVWRRKWLAACWLLLALLGATLSAWPQLRRLLPSAATPADDPLSLTLPWPRTLAGLPMPAGAELTLPAPGSYTMHTGLGGRPELVFFESARFPQPVPWRGLRITAIGGRLGPASAAPAPGGGKNGGKTSGKHGGASEGKKPAPPPLPVWAPVLPLELAAPALLDGWHCAAGPAYLMRPPHAPDIPAPQPAPDDWQLAHCTLASAYRILPAADTTGLLPRQPPPGAAGAAPESLAAHATRHAPDSAASAAAGHTSGSTPDMKGAKEGAKESAKESANGTAQGKASRASATSAAGAPALGTAQGAAGPLPARASDDASGGASGHAPGRPSRRGPAAWVELPAGTRLWRSQTFEPELDPAAAADAASPPARGRRASRPARNPRQPQWLLMPPDDAAIIAPHFALGGSAWQLNENRRLLRWHGQVLANDMPQSERDAAESQAARAALASQARGSANASHAPGGPAPAGSASATPASAAPAAPGTPAPALAPTALDGLCPLPLGSWLSSGEAGAPPGTWQLLHSCTATEAGRPEPLQCGGTPVQVQPCRWLNWERG